MQVTAACTEITTRYHNDWVVNFIMGGIHSPVYSTRAHVLTHSAIICVQNGSKLLWNFHTEFKLTVHTPLNAHSQ